ncbi:hypothetical protein COLO4_14154 [Corchorus olitorius]|uniref:Uncharacterized protein n=1 Tax=Corchorus olitorius TaxID=93759 RepID=A0A1R3JT89_9ROSI|nr:hypothetical protein COLO4_14154 [Corchorus olitorius]
MAAWFTGALFRESENLSTNTGPKFRSDGLHLHMGALKDRLRKRKTRL